MRLGRGKSLYYTAGALVPAITVALVSFAAPRQAAPGPAAPAQVPAAQTPPAGSPPPERGAGPTPGAPKAKETEVWTVEHQGFRLNDTTGEGEARIVTVHDVDTVIRADLLRFNKTRKTAVATGHLNMTDPQADVTGDKADIQYGRSKRIVVVTGNVQIQVKPKKEAETPAAPPAAPASKPTGPATVVLQGDKAQVVPPEDEKDDNDSPRKHPAVITCDRAEYQYAKDKKYAVLTGSFKVVQTLKDRTRTLTAEHAEWYGKDELVVLHPPVHMVDTRENVADSSKVVKLWTKDGDERMEMEGGTATFKVEDEDEEPAAGKGDKAPPKGDKAPPKGDTAPSKGEKAPSKDDRAPSTPDRPAAPPPANPAPGSPAKPDRGAARPGGPR